MAGQEGDDRVAEAAVTRYLASGRPFHGRAAPGNLEDMVRGITHAAGQDRGHGHGHGHGDRHRGRVDSGSGHRGHHGSGHREHRDPGSCGSGRRSSGRGGRRAATDTTAQWAQVSAGQTATCAVQTDRTLWCWGANGYGELGIGSAGMAQPSPVQVGTRTVWVQVSTGYQSACALHGEPTLWCWGNGGGGDLGNGLALGVQPSPGRVGTSPSWLQVSVGTADACGIQRGHTLWCWGDNSAGELGIGGKTIAHPTPRQVTEGTVCSPLGLGRSAHAQAADLSVGETRNLTKSC